MSRSVEDDPLAKLFSQLAAQFPQDGNNFLERCIYDQVYKAGAEAPGVSYEDVVVASRPCKWIRPASASTDHVMIFYHGGGFSFGSPQSHRNLTAHLARACNVPALSVDYRLTPENAYPDPLDDCVAVYKWMLQHGVAAQNIILAGDSCGGGLVTSVPLAAAKAGLPKPGASISLSPWYDLTNGGETRTTNEQNDVLNTKSFVEMLADRYTQGKVSRKDPLISPLFASEDELKALPPHWISVGGYDMLRDDGERFADKARNAGLEVVLEVLEGQQHVCEFAAGKERVADESIRKIGEWVRKKIGS